MVKIIPCTCKHQYQDSKYGSGKRVGNECDKKSVGRSYRCTVCGTVSTKG